ncbi:MAG: hypothetical protein K6E85_06040 [Lachnospiraceae bacterium]|nr:hypothetical protein [Lachnospiraceae bacterium]
MTAYVSIMVEVGFSSFAMIFSMIFYNTIYIYSSENEVNSLEQQNKQLSVDVSEDALTSECIMVNRMGITL